MTVFGWDASDFDWARGALNFPAAFNEGIRFFTHKATENTSTKHVHYGQALNGAKAAGIPFLGAYHVVRSSTSVQAQADYFLSYLDQQTPWWRTYPGFMLQVDLEHWSYDTVSPTTGVALCNELEARTTKRVVLYAPQWAYGNSIGGSHPLWASNYGNNPTGGFAALYPGDNSSRWGAYSGRTPTILQYGSALTIGGSHTCDGNAFRGTQQDMYLWTIGREPVAAIQQSDAVTGYLNRGNSVGDVLADLENLRDWLYMAEPGSGKNPPGPGSRADLLYQAAKKLLGEAPPAPAPAPAPVVDEAKLAADISAALIASNTNGLTASDHDAIKADVAKVISSAHIVSE